MKSHSALLRIPALFLSIALGAPAPAHALRPLNAGAEEQPTGRRKWTVDKVVEVIGRAAASQRPKLSLAPGAIRSASQRSSALGAELHRAYAAVVARKSFPEELPDWPAALRRAGLDPADHYRRGFSAGAEEKLNDRVIGAPISVAAEAVQGPGVVVIDAAIFPQQAGLEQLLKRLPVENRIIVVGAMEGSAAMQEIRARNSKIRFADSLEDAVPLILSLPAADVVSILAGKAFVETLRADLAQFMIQAFELDTRLGLRVLLIALGVPEKVLNQLNWKSVESALSSLEAA